MASMHLAMAGLGRLPRPREAAHRLFLADRLLDRGAEPQMILKALGLGAGVLARLYNPDQPRVPAGSGVESGRWTSGDEGDAPTAAGLGEAPALRPDAEGADSASAPPSVRRTRQWPRENRRGCISVFGRLTWLRRYT